MLQGGRFIEPPALRQKAWNLRRLGRFVLAAKAARADTHAARRAVHVDGGVVQVGLEAPRGLGRASFPLAAVVVADVAPEDRPFAAHVTFSRHWLFSSLDSYACVLYQLSSQSVHTTWTCDCGPSNMASDCAGTPLAGRAKRADRGRKPAGRHRGTEQAAGRRAPSGTAVPVVCHATAVAGVVFTGVAR